MHLNFFLLFRQTKTTSSEIQVIQRAIIEEVTPQHLNNRYTCAAHNTVGNSTVTIKLKKKNIGTDASTATNSNVKLFLPELC